MAAIAKKRRKATQNKKIVVQAKINHPRNLEAPDWGEPIAEGREWRETERAEAPDAGEGVPYESDD